MCGFKPKLKERLPVPLSVPQKSLDPMLEEEEKSFDAKKE